MIFNDRGDEAIVPPSPGSCDKKSNTMKLDPHERRLPADSGAGLHCCEDYEAQSLDSMCEDWRTP